MEDIYYVDSHAHLMAEEYKDDLKDVVQRIEDNQIAKVLLITLEYEETMRAIEFAQQNPERYQVACAIFPEEAEHVTDARWEQFEKTARMKEVQVLGEMGLEYHWVKDPGIRQLQRDLFIKQIQLAKELDKPIAVHARDAMQDTFDIMKEYQHKGLLHCFAGTKEMAREFTKLGYYLALGGALTFKNARHSIEVVEDIDFQYLLTETDCPYMSPVPLRGTRNEPANIPYILQKMAEVKGVSTAYMAKRVMENYERFLRNE